MLKVFYQAIDASGSPREGTLRGRSEELVRSKLERRGWLVQALKVAPSRVPGFYKMGSHMSHLSALRFSGALAALIKSGMAMPRALDVLAAQAKEPAAKKIIESLARSVLQGASLSEALSQFPASFDGLYIKSVRAGERAGELEPALRQIERYGVQQIQVKKRLKRACLYPATVFVIAALVMTILLVGVVPRFERVFFDLSQGASLPTMTAFVIGISNAIRAHGVSTIIMGFLAAGLLWAALRSYALRSWVQDAVMKLPGLCGLVRSSGLARWARTQGLLMQCGVDVLDAWEVSADVVSSLRLKSDLLRARERVRDGERLSRALDLELNCEPALIGFLDTGEQTGELAEQLISSADYLEEAIEGRVQTCLALLEPSLIVVLALMIGALVIALFLPMTSIIEQLSL